MSQLIATPSACLSGDSDLSERSLRFRPPPFKDSRHKEKKLRWTTLMQRVMRTQYLKVKESESGSGGHRIVKVWPGRAIDDASSFGVETHNCPNRV